MSNSIDQDVSISVKIAPGDKRCRFWAKLVRNGTALPLPSDVHGAADLPAVYSRLGDEELFPGDFLFTGEAMHHAKDRGWTYCVQYVGADDKLVAYWNPGTEEKAAMKANGLPRELLAGAGEVAAICRLAHAVKLGVSF